ERVQEPAHADVGVRLERVEDAERGVQPLAQRTVVRGEHVAVVHVHGRAELLRDRGEVGGPGRAGAARGRGHRGSPPVGRPVAPAGIGARRSVAAASRRASAPASGATGRPAGRPPDGPAGARGGAAAGAGAASSPWSRAADVPPAAREAAPAWTVPVACTTRPASPGAPGSRSPRRSCSAANGSGASRTRGYCRASATHPGGRNRSWSG